MQYDAEQHLCHCMTMREALVCSGLPRLEICARLAAAGSCQQSLHCDCSSLRLAGSSCMAVALTLTRGRLPFT